MTLRVWPTAVPLDADARVLPAPLAATLAEAGAVAPVILLVAGPRALESGWAPAAAVALAEGWARDGLHVVLADLAVGSPTLHSLVGEPNDEGLADVFFYGASLRRVMRGAATRNFGFVPAGVVPAESRAVLTDPGWRQVVAHFFRDGAVLLVYLPSDADGLEALATRLGAVIALAAPGDVPELEAALPPDAAVLALLEPPGPRPQPEPEPEPELESESESESESVLEPWAAESLPEEPPSSAEPWTVEPEPADAGSSAEPWTIEPVPEESAASEPWAVQEPEAAPPPEAAPFGPGPGPGPGPVSSEPEAVPEPGAVPEPEAVPGPGALPEPSASEEPPPERRPVFDVHITPQRRAGDPKEALVDALWARRRAGQAARAAPPALELVPGRKLSEAELLAEPHVVQREPKRRRWGVSLLLWLALGALVGLGLYVAVQYYLTATVPFIGGSNAASSVPPVAPGPGAGAGALAPKGAADQGAPGGVADSLPYSVAIEAYPQYASAVERAAALARAQAGVGFFVTPMLDRGSIYYHVMAGPVADSVDAAALMQRLLDAGVKTGASQWDIVATRLAFKLGDYPARAEAARRQAELAGKNVPTYVVQVPLPGGPPRWRVYAGAFQGAADAAVLRPVLKNAGIPDSLVLRTGITPR